MSCSSIAEGTKLPAIMIRSFLFFCLCWLPHLAMIADGQNVAATSSGVAIGTNGGNNGLVVSMAINGERQQLEITNFGGGVSFSSSFDDVTIDPINESLVFALSTASMTVCSFVLDGTATDENSVLQLVNCVGIFSALPFCGVSAYGGTLMISGGTGGFTIYEYDQQSGQITDMPTLLNQLFPNVVGHPDVVLVNANLAALSTDFLAITSKFGTQMASIDATRTSVTFGSDYRVQDSLGFQLFVEPSNFPLENAVYRSSATSRMPLLFTANGPMQVQDLASSEINVIGGAPNGFSAVAVSVHQARQKLYYGGVLASGGSMILIYDLSEDPMNPTLAETKQTDNERITSIASGGDVVVFMTTTNPGQIQFMDLLSSGTTTNWSSQLEPDDAATSDSDIFPWEDPPTPNETPASITANDSGARAFSLRVGGLICSAVLATLAS